MASNSTSVNTTSTATSSLLNRLKKVDTRNLVLQAELVTLVSDETLADIEKLEKVIQESGAKDFNSNVKESSEDSAPHGTTSGSDTDVNNNGKLSA